MWYIPIKDTMLSDLVRTSPVSVSFVPEVNVSPTANAITIGAFYPKKDNQIKTCIEILDSLSKHQKIVTLLHEIGHAKCDMKKCKCIFVCSAEGEIHAYEYALTWLLKNKQKKVLKAEMKYIKNSYDRMDYYGDAVRHIINSKLWQKCLNFVNNP